MKETVLARRYARALFELARERDILVSIANEMASIEDNLQTDQRFRLFLYSQDLSKREKTEKMEKMLQDRVSNVFFNFLLVLLKKNRELIFSAIAKEFQALVDRHDKKTRASATTVVPLDEKSLSKLKFLLDETFKSDVRIDNEIDKSILGGIIVNIDGRLLDGSLRTQLRRLKSKLVETTDGK